MGKKKNVISEEEVARRVKAVVIDKLFCDESEAVPEASFRNDLGADSLDMVELIMEFEKEFNILIPDNDAMTIKTCGKAVKYIAYRKNN